MTLAARREALHARYLRQKAKGQHKAAYATRARLYALTHEMLGVLV